jgi:hypothetical protein
MTAENSNGNVITTFNEICVLLSKQAPAEMMLEKIVLGTQALTKADGASLYIKHGEVLKFHIIKNLSLNMDMNGNSASIKSLPEIPLHPTKNHHSSISSHCAITKKNIHIEDFFNETTIDITATKAFDEKFNYKTKSILAVPILDRKQDVLGVIQLINANNDHQSFNEADLHICESMAALASIALSYPI